MAYGNNNITQYKKNAINTASPLQLVIMLYDGCLRFMTNAEQAMDRQDIFHQNENCQRAQNIITELISTLDMDRGGEIATNLFQLYNYAFDQLVLANINDDKQALRQAMKVFEELRQSWAALEQQSRQPVSTGAQKHAA